MKEVKFRVTDDVYEKIKEQASRLNTSISEYIRELVTRIVMGEQPLDDIPVEIKVVKTIYGKKKDYVRPRPCAFCGVEINKGEHVAWVIKKMADGREVYELWHIDCWEFSSDKALAKKYVEIRKLNRIIKQLKKQADELADVIIDAEARKKVLDVAKNIEEIAQRIEQEFMKVSRDLRDFLYEVDLGEMSGKLKEIDEKYRKIHEEIQDKLEAARKRLDEIAATIAIKPLKKPKKKAEEDEWRRW